MNLYRVVDTYSGNTYLIWADSQAQAQNSLVVHQRGVGTYPEEAMPDPIAHLQPSGLKIQTGDIFISNFSNPNVQGSALGSLDNEYVVDAKYREAMRQSLSGNKTNPTGFYTDFYKLARDPSVTKETARTEDESIPIPLFGQSSHLDRMGVTESSRKVTTARTDTDKDEFTVGGTVKKDDDDLDLRDERVERAKISPEYYEERFPRAAYRDALRPLYGEYIDRGPFAEYLQSQGQRVMPAWEVGNILRDLVSREDEPATEPRQPLSFGEYSRQLARQGLTGGQAALSGLRGLLAADPSMVQEGSPRKLFGQWTDPYASGEIDPTAFKNIRSLLGAAQFGAYSPYVARRLQAPDLEQSYAAAELERQRSGADAPLNFLKFAAERYGLTPSVLGRMT